VADDEEKTAVAVKVDRPDRRYSRSTGARFSSQRCDGDDAAVRDFGPAAPRRKPMSKLSAPTTTAKPAAA
jgi:hypothetical protein